MIDGLGPRLRNAATVEGACALLSAELWERCRSGPAGERTLVLSRVFLSLPFSALDATAARFPQARFGISPQPTDRFLTLMGTQGDRPEWCDRRLSTGHQAIPLNRQTVTTVPMLARCFQQIGFDLDLVLRPEEGIHLEGVASSFGLFHVDEAPGSPFVPSQEEFVRPYGVRSVVGCGSMLPDRAVSIWIGFARHPIGRDAALPLIPLLPSFWLAAQQLYRRRALFAGGRP